MERVDGTALFGNSIVASIVTTKMLDRPDDPPEDSQSTRSQRRGGTRSDRHGRFEALYRDHYGSVWAYARRRVGNATDADDVAAQTWLNVWRRLDDIPASAELPWCYGVARRCLANHRRSSNRSLRLAHAVGTERVVDAVVASSDPRSEQLRAALLLLNEHDQEVLRLATWERLAHRDIAVVLDTTTANVAVRLNRAKGRLKKVLQGFDDVGHTSDTTPMTSPKGTQ